MADIGEEASGRAWWTARLGAVRDPSATFEVSTPTGDRVQRSVVRLVSYGTAIDAMLVVPATPGPVPTVVVPFYDVATLFGERTSRTRDVPDDRLNDRAYGNHLVNRGFAVLAVPWWFEQEADQSVSATSLAERYGPAATRHRASLPITGLGRSVADLLLAVDALHSVARVDQARLGAFGHSLGAKLVLHLAALDVRIRAAVAHEPGLGFAHSNWSDPWYLGDRIPDDRDQDQILGLVAPRPFLLAGGGASDGPHNYDLVERARLAWPADGLQTLYHDGGHNHPDHVLVACYAWLAAHLGEADPLLSEKDPIR